MTAVWRPDRGLLLQGMSGKLRQCMSNDLSH